MKGTEVLAAAKAVQLPTLRYEPQTWCT